MNRIAALLLGLSIAFATPAFALGGASLKGSPSSMVRQNQVAKQNDFTFLRSPAQVERFVEEGYLVAVESNESLQVNAGVSYPVARPEMKLFLERLAEQYRDGCGEALVVTSLVRPTSEQPRNSHPLSVHPAGMAADLRVSSKPECRAWLESALLSLEERELLDVTRERSPPHYHVALYPDLYFAYVQPMLARDSAIAAEQEREQAARLALAAIEEAGSSLVASEETVPGDRAPLAARNIALIFGVIVVVGGAGARRLIARRSSE